MKVDTIQRQYCNWAVRDEIETLDGEDPSPAAVAAEAAPYGRPPAGG